MDAGSDETTTPSEPPVTHAESPGTIADGPYMAHNSIRSVPATDTAATTDTVHHLPSTSSVGTAAVIQTDVPVPIGNRTFDSQEVSQMLNTIQANVSARLAVISNNIARLEARTNTAAHERLMLSQRMSQPRPMTRNTGDPVDRAYTRMSRAMERTVEENELRGSLEAIEAMYERSTAALERAMANYGIAYQPRRSFLPRTGSAGMGPSHRIIELGSTESPISYADAVTGAQPSPSNPTQTQAPAASGDATDRAAMQRLWEHLAYRRQARVRAQSSNEVDDGITSRGRRVMAREGEISHLENVSSYSTTASRTTSMTTPSLTLRTRARPTLARPEQPTDANLSQSTITRPAGAEVRPTSTSPAGPPSFPITPSGRLRSAAEYRRIANDIFLLGLEDANDAAASGNNTAEDSALNELIRHTRRTTVSQEVPSRPIDDGSSHLPRPRTPEVEPPQFWSTSPDRLYIHPPRSLRMTSEAHLPFTSMTNSVETTNELSISTAGTMLVQAIDPQQRLIDSGDVRIIDAPSSEPVTGTEPSASSLPRMLDLTRRALGAAQARLRHVPTSSRARPLEVVDISSDEEGPSSPTPISSNFRRAHEASESRARRRSWVRINPDGELVITDDEDDGLSQQELRRQRSRLTSHSTTNLNDPHQYHSMLSQARSPATSHVMNTNRRQAQRARLMYLPSPLSENHVPDPSNGLGVAAGNPTEWKRFSSGSGAFRSIGQANVPGRPFVPYPLPMRLEDMR
ncbi:hypothetical protein FRB97_001676 [Tulasnella sp. 331]|nr:hypothetical protein FRB97_001676 [Tulasnella sp. 331]